MFQDETSLFISALTLVAILLFFALQNKKSKESFSNSFGSNSYLNAFTIDFTALARQKKLNSVIGREKEVMKLVQILSRREKNNAILVGLPGVGKTAIVEALAERIISHDVPSELWEKRVLSLDVANLLSGTKYRGEFEERAKKILQEIINSNRNIILFIDEIHTVIQSRGTEGAINFSDILKPALARGDLQMIGATTTNDYEQYIKTDSSLERRFQLIKILEPSLKETAEILKGVKDKYREYHKVEFTDEALNVAINLSNKLIKDRKFPDKALDALDEAGAMVKVSHIHTKIPTILYQAATQKNPKATTIWNKIQKLDKINNNETNKKREQLEAELEKIGVITVDRSDIEKIIKNW